MKTSSVIASLFGVISLATAAPTEKKSIFTKRQSTGISDADILQYALTLEHLEAAFYRTGLSAFDASAFANAGYPPWVRNRVTEIGQHEATHVAFLTQGLTAAGASPVQECTYDFSAATDPKSFLAVAQILEGVGVAAYLGAAPNVTSKTYLAYAGAVLSVETRHNAWIRGAVMPEDSFPEAFEVALSFNEVYSLAAPFFKSCPSSNPTLPLKAFPALTASTAGPYSPNQTVQMKANSTTAPAYAAFIGPVSNVFVPWNNGSVKIPDMYYGQTYVVATSDNSTVSDSNTVAGPAILEIPLQAKDYGVAAKPAVTGASASMAASAAPSAMSMSMSAPAPSASASASSS